MTKPILLNPDVYIQDIIQEIHKAHTRICILAMMIVDDESTTELIAALESAAKRGVSVKISADVFTYAELSGFFFPTKYRTKAGRSTNLTIARLKKSGVAFTWLGAQSTTIVNGRTHSKWSVVDDIVYSFGGVNLYKGGIENTDYMFKIKDPLIASNLWGEYGKIVHANRHGYTYRSRHFETSIGIVLIDSGMFGDSIIYRRVCKLASQASSVLLVSQYCPSGKLSKILKRTDSRLYFNRPRQATRMNRILISLNMLMTGTSSLYTREAYIHAKYMIFTMPDGKKIAITGSHNFVNSSSLLGTREIALQTDDPAIIGQLETFSQNNIF